MPSMSLEVAQNLPSPGGQSNATSGHAISPTSSTPRNSFSRPSSSRAINPAPPAPVVAPKVAIPAASSPGVEYGNPSPGAGAGPSSTNYVIPPRPKPGRKPATDEPASKRKAQNRESQRAFRQRKAQKLEEMSTQVATLEKRHQAELIEKERIIAGEVAQRKSAEKEIADLREQNQKLLRELNFWKVRADQSGNEMSRRNSLASLDPQQAPLFYPRQPDSRQDSPTRASTTAFTPQSPTPYATPNTAEMNCGNCKPDGPCACMDAINRDFSNVQYYPAVPLSQGPRRGVASSHHIGSSPSKTVVVSHFAPEQFYNSSQNEIDFTGYHMNTREADRKRAQAMMQLGGHGEMLPEEEWATDDCGFCSDNGNCICKGTFSHERLEAAETPQSAFPVKMDSAIEPTMAPGSCADCLKDPKQREWCQRVAQSSRPDSARTTSSISNIDPMEPRASYSAIPDMIEQRDSIGCNEAYKVLDGRVPTDSDRMDWSTLRPISTSARVDNIPSLRTYSALELDTAGVIATLQHSTGPLKPRRRDGNYADLVRLAASNRRNSTSSQVGASNDSGMHTPTSPSHWGLGGFDSSTHSHGPS